MRDWHAAGTHRGQYKFRRSSVDRCRPSCTHVRDPGGKRDVSSDCNCTLVKKKKKK